MTPTATKTVTIQEEEVASDSETDSGWKTILFNCECHTFDQVETQLVRAVRCTLSQARKYSWEVHSKGSAVVYRGARERCEAAASVLGEIGLLVQVAQ